MLIELLKPKYWVIREWKVLFQIWYHFTNRDNTLLEVTENEHFRLRGTFFWIIVNSWWMLSLRITFFYELPKVLFHIKYLNLYHIFIVWILMRHKCTKISTEFVSLLVIQYIKNSLASITILILVIWYSVFNHSLNFRKTVIFKVNAPVIDFMW